ncbi:hypothetical protein H4R20_000737 [Coemansia guatemalensis]|uniref:Proteinase inhibitor I78 n=1 Tax=Coemansia guatemalensis TaxID=2761395 RepID=A0A9W8I4N4_9FUNG|nr:hypothetical protein H4R20_000737 [Coemansia guatemalensis]
MGKFGNFQIPSAEEQEAKVAHWKGKLVDRYLKDERDPRLKPQLPADTQKPQDATTEKQSEEKQKPQDNAAEKPAAETQKPKEEAKDTAKETAAKEPWLYEDNGTKMVQASLIPGTVRCIWPGTPVTRDLRWDRMNIMCDKDGLITNVSFG